MRALLLLLAFVSLDAGAQAWPQRPVRFIVSQSAGLSSWYDKDGTLSKQSGAIIGPGQTETWTVSLAPGQYLLTCGEPFHVDRGMSGAIQVTP